MNLQDIMLKLSAYSVGCRIMDGNFLINITYDEGWKVIPPENEKIEFAQKGKVTYYAAAINEVSFDDVFKSIKETIDYNVDLQRKVTLFKTKVDELQELFANESLERLRTISFIFDEKKKPKRKYVRKEKKNDINTSKKNEITETSNDDTSVEDKKTQSVEETLETDSIIYNEYKGEDITDNENKVDYLEQLNQ